ncbi:MAG: energy transducer TonB [Rhodospirillales bacterium]|nr:energy transducer TonB [Rhodospirillales bacterium]
MNDLRVHKTLCSSRLPFIERAAGGALSLGLSVALHIGLVGAGLLIGYYTYNTGSAMQIGETVPIYVTFVQDTETAVQTPEAIETAPIQKTEGKRAKEEPMLVGTAPLPEPKKQRVERNIEQISSAAPQKRASVPAASQGALSGQFAGTQSADEIRYIDRVRAIIESNRIYPGAARRRKLEGTAVIQIRIDRDGHILGHQFIESSGHHALDQAVLSMIKASDPLPAMPPSVRKTTMSIKIPIGFQLQ